MACSDPIRVPARSFAYPDSEVELEGMDVPYIKGMFMDQYCVATVSNFAQLWFKSIARNCARLAVPDNLLQVRVPSCQVFIKFAFALWCKYDPETLQTQPATKVFVKML